MSHKNMKEELTCPICMELFRQPRRLPCGHSYCYICLKAMLDRCTEFNGLYLDYSRSLVCPECREEVSIETDRGVDMIPPDFKLSKLVDLFKFMKKNDSSDSSCDELQSSTPAAHADSSPAPTPAAAEVISLPATSPSTGPSSSQASHLFTAAATIGRPTQPLHVSPPSTAADASTSTVSAGSQLQSRHTHQNIESPGEGAVSATGSNPSLTNHADAEYNIGQATAVAISSTAVPVATHNGEISVYNTCHVDRDACPNNLPPATTSCSSVITSPGPSQSRASAFGTQLHLSGVAVSSASPRPDSHDSFTDGGRNPSEDFSSVSEQGIDGGIEALRDNANGSSVRPEQHVDSLEILSNWVNENHFYSQGSRNLSHSAASLPVEVVLEEAESCHENSPELTGSIARGTRAQSVPTETGEWHRSAQPGGSGEHVASKGLHHVKARKVKRGVFSRFVDSDTSSDSSSSNVRQQPRSTGRPKRWLMTRFLRSVILSDSSSPDYSDDDDEQEEERNAACSQRERKTLHSTMQNNFPTARQQSYQQTGALAAGSSQEAFLQRIPESNNHNTDSNTAHDVTFAPTPTGETVPRSVDSSTLAKEPVRGREDTLSCADTLPKATHSWKSAGDGQHTAPLPLPAAAPHGQDRHLPEPRSESCDTARHIPRQVSSSARRRHGEQTCRTDLPGAGSPPTFYDNFNALSDDGEGRTLYDNVGSEGASPGAEGSPAGLVRALRLNPHHQQQSVELTSERGHGRTLYNVDSRHTRPEQTSAQPGHGHIQGRNPVTDIDDLKTGFEHNQTGNMNSIVADSVAPSAGLQQEAGHILHMGELDNSTTGLFQSSQAAQCASEHLPEPGYVCSSREQRHAVSTDHVPVGCGDHHSLYDNMNNSQSLAHQQGSTGVSNSVRHTEGGTLCEDGTARSAQRERDRGAGHLNTFSAPGRNGEDELQYVDNYLDHYSEQFRNAPPCKNAASSKNAAPSKSAAFAKSAAAKNTVSANNAASAKNENSSGKTVGRMSRQKSGVGVATHESSAAASPCASGPTAGCSSRAAGATSYERRNVQGGRVLQDGADMEVVDSENISNSSTCTQDKKKPRSRLKKFLTSLLSLSSSSSDDEQPPGETSSESSDW